MKVAIFLIIFLSWTTAFCQTQSDKYVHFVYVGMEEKPVYNIIISTHKISIPANELKPGFEQTLITSEGNYADLCKAIKQNQYLKMNTRASKNDKPFYKVFVSGASFLLDEGNSFMFFRKVTLQMEKKPAEADIVAKLQYINTRNGR